MSGAIWGTPLVLNGLDTHSDAYSAAVGISDLNNWSKRSLENLAIDYDSSTRTNTFSYKMGYGSYEAFYYEFPVEHDTWYQLNMTVCGSFEEEINRPGTHMWVAVCNTIPDTTYFDLQFSTAEAKFLVLPYKTNNISLDVFTKDLDKVYLWIDMSACTDKKTADFIITSISFRKDTGDPIHYAQKPFNLNILGGDVWNFIAVEPGAWFYSVFDDHKTHHVYFLAGNEFKLLEFQDADSSGTIPHKEYHSIKVTVKGRTYYALYLSRTVDSVCPFPTEYCKLSELPSDEYFYERLSEYVLNEAPYDRGDVLGFLALRNLLSANSGDVNVDLDDLKAMLKGYTVEERRNPYLDDPNLDDAGYPTTSFHD